MRSLLLDRDGVLLEERDYDYAPENIQLLPGVVEGLQKLSSTYRFFVVSNQSGVASGRTTLEAVQACNEQLRAMLNAEGIHIEEIVVCPHGPDENCDCRKPKTGMWEELRTRFDLRAEDCVMVGNRSSDIEFGRNIGCFTVQVQDHHGVELLPDLVVASLTDLADFLVRNPHPKFNILPIEKVEQYCELQREAGSTIVTTNGSFDLLHDGHKYLLAEARAQGDILIVGVNSDASVKRYKGPDRPIESQDVRARKVAAFADAVFIFDDDDPRPWLPKVRPNVHVNAETYGADCVEAPLLNELGARLVLIPVKPELGSTTLILHSRNE